MRTNSKEPLNFICDYKRDPAPFLEELALSLAGDGERLGLLPELSGGWFTVHLSLPIRYRGPPPLLYHVEFRHHGKEIAVKP